MKQTFKVVIPSYGRAEAIGRYTLKYLKSTNIDPDQIYVFVSNAAEKEKYLEANPGIKTVIAAGTRSLVEKRRFISTYFEKGTRLLSLDDDVSGLQRLVLLEKLDGLQKPLDFPCKLETVTDLVGFVENGWDLASKREIGLWGAYAVANRGFLHPKITTGLKFVMGHFFSFCAGDAAFNDIEKFPCKDDIFLSLWHYVNAKGTLRFDNYCVKSKAHSGAGGSCDDLVEKLAVNNDTCARLCENYSELASIKMRKTKDPWLSKYQEIRLKTVTTETIDVRESCY